MTSPRATTAPAPTDLASARRLRQQQIAAAAAQQANRMWGYAATSGWTVAGGSILAAVQHALVEAARGAQAYVTAAARAWGATPDPAGLVNEPTFAATASDGRPLDTLLEQPWLERQAFIGEGMDPAQADAIGRRHLQRIVTTQVGDAARVATGVAIVNDRALTGYIRHLTLPSCSRCIILAGRWYRYDAGFARHPLCDCVGLPATDPIDPASPREVYDSLTDEERRNAGWSGHDQRAIDDGADLNQITNYRQELKSVSIAGRTVQTTLVGTTRRGVAGKRLGGGKRKSPVRLTPESIYAEAQRLGWDRDEVIRQLRRFGYIL